MDALCVSVGSCSAPATFVSVWMRSDLTDSVVDADNQNTTAKALDNENDVAAQGKYHVLIQNNSVFFFHFLK